MVKNSFRFGTFNSVVDWGIQCIKYAPLRAEKRDNRMQRPFNSISYKPPNRRSYYNDQLIPVRCVMNYYLPRFDLREIIYELSQERELSFWDEPELHYVAELYESTELITWMAEAGREFTLNFLCHPFAYSEMKRVEIKTGSNDVPYGGFEPAPCIIELVNDSPFTVSDIQITTIKET